MLVQLTGEQRGGDGVRRKLRDGESPPCPGSAQPGCRRARGSLVCPLTCWGPALAGGYIRRAVLAGASLAVLRGRGSLSVFVLLLLHLLHDFPDLALGSLTGKEMPNDFDNDLLVLIRGLVSRHNDFCTR